MNTKPKVTKDEALNIVCEAIIKYKIRHYAKIWSKVKLSRYYGKRDNLKNNEKVKSLLDQNFQNYQNDYIKELQKDLDVYKKRALELLQATEQKEKIINGKNIKYIQRANPLLIKHLFLANELQLSYLRYKDIGLYDDEDIMREIEFNVTQIKKKKYSDLINNSEHNACVTVLKLIGTDDERKNLGGKLDITSKDKKIGNHVELTPEEIKRINKVLESEI